MQLCILGAIKTQNVYLDVHGSTERKTVFSSLEPYSWLKATNGFKNEYSKWLFPSMKSLGTNKH